MFFLDKDKIKNKIENTYARLKVLSITSHFPSKIKLTLEERSAYMYIVGEENYYLLDKDYKIVTYCAGWPCRGRCQSWRR